MASTILYAPQVSATQPAFIYTKSGGVKINFSFSAYNTINDISGILVSVINPTISSTDGLDNMVEETTYGIRVNIAKDNIEFDNDLKSYYFNLPMECLKSLNSDNLNQWYQVQLYFYNNNALSSLTLITEETLSTYKSNISAASQITLIYPIAALGFSSVSFSNFGDKLEHKKIGYQIQLNENPEKIYSYSFTFGSVKSEEIKNTFGAEENLLKGTLDEFLEDGNFSVSLSYKTVHGYEGEFEKLDTTLDYSVSGSDPMGTLDYEADLELGGFAFKIPTGEYLQKSLDGEVWKTISGTGVFLDLNLESGQKYSYRVVNATSKTVLSKVEKIEIDFEDIFLLDKDTLMAVRYNPNITGFKWVVQENITNTIGGAYPIIRRNGDTYYRQFTLGGTLFADGIEYAGTGSTPNDSKVENSDISSLVNHLGSSDLILFAERPQLKSSTKRGVETEARHLMEAFLTNGKPKLFRSAEEGNMIVYLSNVSFTPNRQLGRHIYDFSATATEFCDCTNKNLIKYQLIAANYSEPTYDIALETGNPVTRLESEVAGS